MKVEEPTFVYQSQPTATRLRGQIINSVEHEEDIHALRHLWVVIEQMKKDGKNRIPKKRLSELRGVLKTAKTNKTYKEMREEYMMEKYGLRESFLTQMLLWTILLLAAMSRQQRKFLSPLIQGRISALSQQALSIQSSI